MAALRPARKLMVPRLGEIFADALREPALREIAADILADYAADDPARLVDLAAVAEPKQFNTVLPKLADKANRRRGIELLEADLRSSQARPLRDWKDPPLDPSWPDPAPAIAAQLAAALGVLESRYAFCQTLPIESFDAVAEALRGSGYRPARLRPYSLGDRVQVAAIWQRDGADCVTAIDLTADEVRARDGALQADGYVPLDVAGYGAARGATAPRGDGQAGNRFAALWARRTDDSDQRRLHIEQASGDPADENELRQMGFAPATLQSYFGPTDEPHYAMIWSKRDGPGQSFSSLDERSYSATAAQYGLQVDVSLARGPFEPPPRPDPAQRLARAEQAVAANLDDLKARFERGQSHFAAGNFQAAVDDLTFVAEKIPIFAGGFQWRAQAYARLGRPEQARADLAKFTTLTASASQRVYLDALVAAQLGEREAGIERLEAAVAKHSQDGNFLYDAACTAALIAPWFADDLPERRDALKRLAVELLARAIECGFDNYSHMQSDSDLDALRDDAAFQ
ncbi:MAG TPA: hypothetical protein VMV69_12540 [Pirellulales bacterium]|nr:hypothetical protein [Pirellulales bacterium]